MHPAMTHFAARCSADPHFLGYLLALHRQDTGCTEAQQMGRLGVSIDDFHRLCMCGRPRLDRALDDLQRCAEHVGADAAELTAMVWSRCGRGLPSGR